MQQHQIIDDTLTTLLEPRKHADPATTQIHAENISFLNRGSTATTVAADESPSPADSQSSSSTVSAGSTAVFRQSLSGVTNSIGSASEESLPAGGLTSSAGSEMVSSQLQSSAGPACLVGSKTITPPLSSNGRSAGASKRYACTKCDRHFGRRDELNIHYTHTHRERPRYACDSCELVFMVKRELSTHVRIHNGEQPQRCRDCGMEFGTRQLLNKHQMVHSGVRSHYCPVCPQAFFQKGHLTQHMQIHAGVRPHKCALCVKTFIFKFDLNRHMKIHAERGGGGGAQTAGACARCGKNFARAAALDEHVAKCKKQRTSFRTDKKSMAKRRHESSSISFDDSKAKLIKLEPASPAVIPSLPYSFDCSSTKEQQIPIAPAFDARLLVVQHFAGLLAAAAAARNNFVAPIAPAPIDLRLAEGAKNMSAPQPPNFATASLLFHLAQLATSGGGGSAAGGIFCAACGRRFDSQPSYLVHWSTEHLRPVQQQQYFGQQQQRKREAQQILLDGPIEFQKLGSPGNGVELRVDCGFPPDDTFQTKLAAVDSPMCFPLDAQLIHSLLVRQTQNAAANGTDGTESATTSSCASSPQKASPRRSTADDFQSMPPPSPLPVAPPAPPPGGVSSRDCALAKELSAARNELRQFLKRVGAAAAAAAADASEKPSRIVLSAN